MSKIFVLNFLNFVQKCRLYPAFLQRLKFNKIIIYGHLYITCSDNFLKRVLECIDLCLFYFKTIWSIYLFQTFQRHPQDVFKRCYCIETLSRTLFSYQRRKEKRISLQFSKGNWKLTRELALRVWESSLSSAFFFNILLFDINIVILILN